MALLKEVAERLSNNMLVAGVVEEIVTEDDLFNLLSFRQVSGKAYVYNRELTLPSVNFAGVGDEVAESAGTVEEVITRLRAIIGDVDVDGFLAGTMSDTNSQKALQIAMKIKAMGRTFRDKLINGAAYSGAITSGNPTGFLTAIADVSDACGKGAGQIELDVSETKLRFTAPGDSASGAWVSFGTTDGTYTLYSGQPSRYVKVTLDASELGASDATIVVTFSETKEFTGLKRLVTPNQIVNTTANGQALGWDLLDQLFDKVKAGPVSAVLMNERTIRAYRALLRAAGGVDSAMLQLPNFGAPVLTLNGVPVLKNNFIATTDAKGSGSNLTSVYAVHVGDAGLQALYGGDNAGIVVEEVGKVQNKDADRTRVKWYTGLANHSTLAIARLDGITN